MKIRKNLTFAVLAALAVTLLFQTPITLAGDHGEKGGHDQRGDKGQRADNGNAAFSVTVGAGHTDGNIMAKAKNGDSVGIIGQGQMDAGAGTASLSGSYVIRDAAGNVTVSGNWHSTKFLSWEPTQACTGGFDGYVSGTARFEVQLDGIGEAHLSVTCAGCETPMGTDAVTLHIKEGQNFKESVNNEPSGGLFGDFRYMNLFFRQ